VRLYDDATASEGSVRLQQRWRRCAVAFCIHTKTHRDHRRTHDFTMEGVTLVDTRVWFGESGARAYNGGLAEPPAGSRGRAPGQGVGAKPPEAAGTFLGPERPKDVANLLGFVL